MPDAEHAGFLARFKALPTDSVPKTIAVAVTLCLVASMVVSAAAVILRPIQERNRLLDKQLNVLQVAGAYEPGIDIAKAFSAFEPHILSLESGQFTDQFEIESFDQLARSTDPEIVRQLSDDPAGIGSQLKYQMVYILRDQSDQIDKVVLPIKGYGLWSTMYGFIALEENGNDVFGLQFYQHGETPGLGAEIDNPRWKSQWREKQLFDESGELKISVAKSVSPAGKQFHVDALAGATLTSRGVDNLVKFWMGKQGYGPFLKRLQAGVI